MAALRLERFITIASAEEKKRLHGRKRFYAGISAHDAKAGAQRSKVFDKIANQ
jgi:hypothetical protein